MTRIGQNPSPPEVPKLPSSNSFSNDVSELASLHNADKHFAAYRLLSRLDNSISASCDFQNPDQSALASILSTPFFQTVRSQCLEANTLREKLSSCTSSWTPSYTGENTRVWYRKEENTHSHSILTEGIIRAPLVNIAVLIYEADLYQHLFWYVSSALAIPVSTHSLLKRAAHIAVFAPWPLHSRDVAVYAYAVDALDEEDGGSVMVASRSLQDSDNVEGVPEPAAKTVRIDMHSSGFELIPEEPGVIKAKFLYNVDPKLSFIPMSLINWCARMFCRWSLRILESRGKDLSKLPKEYQERLDSSPVYEHIRNRLDEFWTSRGISKQVAIERENAATQASRTSDQFDPNATPQRPPPGLVRSLIRGDRAQTGENDNGSSRRTGRLSRLFSG